MNNVVSWRHLVNWSWLLGVIPHFLAVPAVGVGGYYLATMHAGKAAATTGNTVVTYGLLAVGMALALLGVVTTWRATSGTNTVEAVRQKALSLYASTALQDSTKMDLLQRLAVQSTPAGSASVAALADASVPDLLRAIELRVSKDVAERLVGKVSP